MTRKEELTAPLILCKLLMSWYVTVCYLWYTKYALKIFSSGR